MKNRLAKEKSPYLLQHAANPVDWFPWGTEAFDKAKKENKPIFLSIGYSTCHWCHVMEHESFENEEVARLLNQDFVSIKVDREERPDIDHIYMSAVQAMTGSGGWPLTVFLTPEGKPFTGGTYFPPEDKWGRSGMKSLLPKIVSLWQKDRAKVEGSGNQLAELLQQQSRQGGRFAQDDKNFKIFDQLFEHFNQHFDPQYGGFGHAPKFPRSHELSFLLRYWKRTGSARALEMVKVTLDFMARGGMYDQLGGGFHRYSTDEKWLIPHFEKMLYDQAILAKTYLEAYQATREPFFRDIAIDIFRYVERDMTHPEGGFYSAEDADSEGEEGKFYAWRPEEIIKILGPEAGKKFNELYGVTDGGNFEHATSALHTENHSHPEESRKKLFEARKKRIPPYKDDKILTSWNGLMISAFALGAQILGDSQYAKIAQRAAEFILKKLQKNGRQGRTSPSAGRLMRRFREGEAAIPAFQEDYAFFALGLLDLYEATFEARWLEEAKRLTDEMIRFFWDENGGGFFYTASDAEVLIARSKEYYDGATPSGNSIAALVLIRLFHMTSEPKYDSMAEKIFQSLSESLIQYPAAYPQALMAYDFALGPSKEMVLTGDRQDPAFLKLERTIHETFIPSRTLLYRPQPGKPSVSICENKVCKPLATTLEELKKIL